jgi:hypothetical protein
VVDHLVKNQVVGTLDRLRREVNHLAVPQKSRKLDSDSPVNVFGVGTPVSNYLRAEGDAFVADEDAL